MTTTSRLQWVILVGWAMLASPLVTAVTDAAPAAHAHLPIGASVPTAGAPSMPPLLNSRLHHPASTPHHPASTPDAERAKSENPEMAAVEAAAGGPVTAFPFPQVGSLEVGTDTSLRLAANVSIIVEGHQNDGNETGCGPICVQVSHTI